MPFYTKPTGAIGVPFRLRLFLLHLFFLLPAAGFAQAPVFSSTRFGALRLRAPLDSVNKYLAQPLVFAPLRREEGYRYDTAFTQLGGIRLRLVFGHEVSEVTKRQSIELYSVYSEDSALATKSGIRPGFDKFDLVKKLDGSYLSLAPDTDKGKGYSLLSLLDVETGTRLQFYFRNNRLYAVELLVEESDDC